MAAELVGLSDYPTGKTAFALLPGAIGQEFNCESRKLQIAASLLFLLACE